MHELTMLHFHDPKRYEMPLESFTEEILVNYSVIWKSLLMLILPNIRCTLQLMSCILGLQTFSQP